MLGLVFVVLVPNLEERRANCGVSSQPVPVFFYCPHHTPTYVTFFFTWLLLSSSFVTMESPFFFCPLISVLSPCSFFFLFFLPSFDYTGLFFSFGVLPGCPEPRILHSGDGTDKAKRDSFDNVKFPDGTQK